MKTLKLNALKAKESSRIRRKAQPVLRADEPGSLPFSLIDTQPLRTMKVDVNARRVAPVPPPLPAQPLPVGTPALSLADGEADQGYDPYNNYGADASGRRRATVARARH